MIKIRKSVDIKGRIYKAGEEYKPKKNDMPLIIWLNENGFIEPLNSKELLETANSFIMPEKEKKLKKEGGKTNGINSK